MHISRPTLCSKQSLARGHICMARTPALAPKPQLRPTVQKHQPTRVWLLILQNAVKARYSLIAIVREREGRGGTPTQCLCVPHAWQ